MLLGTAVALHAQIPYRQVQEEVNARMVKLFGSGGVRGVEGYGTGIVVSPQGHILTLASQLLDTPDLKVHLADGRRMKATLVVMEPALDVALVKVKSDNDQEELDLPYFDIVQAAKRPMASAGDWVLAFSNQFQIATRDEPMTVQHGVIAAVAKLAGRRGIFEAPYNGDVYFLDAITNNPGSAGGALTNRKGELIGIIGRELRNTLSDTWINYAMPLTAKIEVREGEQVVTRTLSDFVLLGMQGKYKPTPKQEKKVGYGGYTGIVFVPKVIDRTPAYIEEVEPNSPAEKAGLQPDDLIAYVDGEPLTSIATFQEIVRRAQPGTTVLKLEVRRGTKLVPIELRVESKPAANPPK